MDNFSPIPQASETQAVTGTAATVTFTAGAQALLLTNVGTVTVFWRFGSTAATVAADTPLAAGDRMIVSVAPSVTQLSVIAGGAGSTLYVTPGSGEI